MHNKFLPLTLFCCDGSGVSSFNEFIHELSVDSDTSSTTGSISSEDDDDDNIYPASPLSQSSRLSHSSSITRYDRRLIRSIRRILSWILWPATVVLWLPFILFQSARSRRRESVSPGNPETHQLLGRRIARRSFHIKDHVVQRTTDRRRGVFEVLVMSKLNTITFFEYVALKNHSSGLAKEFA